MSNTIGRRETLGLLGWAAFQGIASGQAPQFPKGAVIRTVLKDLTPEELAGGATLFHEHMSFAADFMPRWIALARAGRGTPNNQTNPTTGRGATPASTPPAASPTNAAAANQPFFMDDIDLMVEEMKAAKADGVACLVDGGHEDMGRKLDNLKLLSERSGLPIVASGGYYSQPFYPA